jgi:hypothetical protein
VRRSRGRGVSSWRCRWHWRRLFARTSDPGVSRISFLGSLRMPPPNLYRCLIIGDTISCPATAGRRSEEALRAQELPAIHWCTPNPPAERRGMLFPRLVLIPHLHWSPVFGSASRPAGRSGFGRLTVTPSPKSIPHRSADASALRSRSGLRFHLPRFQVGGDRYPCPVQTLFARFLLHAV